MLDIEQQLKLYTGNVPLLLSLRSKIETSKLNTAERILAQQLLSDKATQIEIHSAGIDWSKYVRLPKDHQKESVAFLSSKNRAILGDDMGLGKTYSAIVGALETKATRILILCHKHLVFNWRSEVKIFTNDVTIIKDGKEKWEPAKFTIMNYEKIPKYLEQMREHKFEVIIADEAHSLSHYKTLRSKTFGKLIARSKAHVWLLTGTPIANRPSDYYNLLKICRHPLTVEQGRWSATDNAWIRYGKKYCAGKYSGFGWDFSGASNINDLHEQTKEYILRRTKETHLKLPPKVVMPFILGLYDQEGYKQIVKETFQERYKDSRDIFSENYGSDPLAAEQLVTFSIIRKFLALQKITDGSTLGLITDSLTEGKKVIVFTNYTAVIDALSEELGEACTYIDGRIKNEERQARVLKFQEDPNCQVIICNYKVGKMGWNLTAARTTIMNDIDWSPEANMQAQDRNYRIGQEESVNILYPQYEDTIEPLLYEILMLKIQIFRHAVDGIPMTDDPERLKPLTKQLFDSIC